MKRRDFICGLSCMLAGFGLCEAKTKMIPQKKCNNPSKDMYIPINKELSEIYIETTFHCNLTCKSCDAFSPISKQEMVKYDEFLRDFSKIKELYPNKDIDILYLGGEPLLNPDLLKMVKKTRELFPNGKQSIMTNGILLADMDEEFWNSMKNNNVKLRVTCHPVDIDRKKSELLAEKYGIELESDVIYSDKLYDINTHKVTKNNLENSEQQKKCKHHWSKPIMDISGSQDYIEKFYTCVHRCFGNSYFNGNLYLCWRHTHLRVFSDYFNLNIPITKNDYIKIADVKDAKEINDFISSPNKLCSYCKQCHNTCFNGKPKEWGFSEKDISEWT